jgi:hypothetical protein
MHNWTWVQAPIPLQLFCVHGREPGLKLKLLSCEMDPVEIRLIRKACIKEREKRPVPEFIDPRFRENKPKTLVFT